MMALVDVLAEHRPDPEYPNTCVCETALSDDEMHYVKHLAVELGDWAPSDEAVWKAAQAILDDDHAKGRATDKWEAGADQKWFTDNARAALTAVWGESDD